MATETLNETGLYSWKESDFLGKGAFGSVYKGHSKQNGEQVAVKVLDMKLFQSDQAKHQLHQEIEVMKKLDSPYIVRMIEATEKDEKTVIILELCPEGDLNNLLRSQGGQLEEQMAIDVISQLLLGFKNLIDQGFIHRDVKPANVLIKEGRFKLSDFGFATGVDIKSQQLLKECVGTPLFMSPQLLKGEEYTAKSDIWSIGMMYYLMLFGKTPWPVRDLKSFVTNIELVPLRFPYDKQISQESKDFLSDCLVVEEERRIDWQGIFNHPLTKRAQGLAQDPRFTLDQRSKNIIRDVQEAVQIKNLDIQKMFKEFAKKNQKALTSNEFYQLLASIDPRLTSPDSDYLFLQVDQNSDSTISLEEFIKFFLEYDFSDLTDKAGQLIIDLKEIIKANKMNMFEIFEKYDENKGGTLDLQEFSKMIRQVANGLSKFEIEVIFRRFDINKDNNIDFKEFVRAMTYGLDIGQKTDFEFSGEKAKKIIKEFKRIVEENNLSLQEILTKFDVDWDNALSRREFRDLIRVIDKRLTSEEVNFIFDIFDSQGNNLVTIDDLMTVFKEKKC